MTQPVVKAEAVAGHHCPGAAACVLLSAVRIRPPAADERQQPAAQQAVPGLVPALLLECIQRASLLLTQCNSGVSALVLAMRDTVHLH